MKVSQFDFSLPSERIAITPLEQRDQSRMLVVREKILEDRITCELIDYLEPGDVVVANDTRVFPARINIAFGTGKIEILLHQKKDSQTWSVFVKPAKKLLVGSIITFSNNLHAEVIAKTEDGQCIIKFSAPHEAVIQFFEQHGEVPLPPYIAKKRTADKTDTNNYQTVYARTGLSVAAPTAGLHFTKDLIGALFKKGVHVTYLNLEVGAGTFQPVKVEDTNEHRMHSERYSISKESCDIINAAKANRKRILAVGTTSMRTLETVADNDGVVKPMEGETSIFITPGYQFKCVDMLLTNFHLPKSTLFMLVSAFAGLETMQRAYQHAINQHYRFYSYGDATLLFKGTDL